MANDILGEVAEPDIFSALETQSKRTAFYTSHMKLIPPKEVLLWQEYTVNNGVKRHISYYIPFDDNLRSFLSLPEIWREFQNSHSSNNAYMHDICDGSFIRNHDLFLNHPQALQIILYTDDIEIVNPIGSHSSKHKLTMFYFTLANISPHYRSTLPAIQLLAVAKARDLKSTSDAMHVLLADFTDAVNRMMTTGVEFLINGSIQRIYRNVICVPCDSLASSWLGGFKESSSFAYKGCRTCKATNQAMKLESLEFVEMRDENEHREQCEILDQLSSTSQKYWSKMWGVNKKSALLNINDFPLCSALVHDPMHIFMEGVIPYELSLMLFNFVYVEHHFNLKFLNNRIKSFPYTYLHNKDVPEVIDKNHVLCGKLKQTAVAVMTLCYTLPFMVGHLIPSGNEMLLNFLRLEKIMLPCTSPYCNTETVAILKLMIKVHHMWFVRLYPKESITPKMHYMLHLPQQMLMFGPLRATWCMRFEAKHNCFKGKKWKNFKNLPLSVSMFHQKLMCSRHISGLGQPNENLLYAGDEVKVRSQGMFSRTYPNLFDSFRHLCIDFPTDPEPWVYFGKEITILGQRYKPGCALVTGYDNDDIPQMAKLRDIVIYNDTKYLIVDVMDVCDYNEHLIAYVLRPKHQHIVVRHTD